MNKTDIKNVRFELIEPTLKGYKTIRVVFYYNGEDKSYYIFVKEGKNVNYIAQAKKQFYQELESGEVARTLKLVLKKSNCPWLIATASVLGVAAIVFMILFVHKCSASNTHIVTFDTLGGSHIDSIRVKDGSKVKKPDDPAKIDYYFGGWFISKDYAGGGYNFDTPVTKDITLYAEWFSKFEFTEVIFDGGENSVVETTEHSPIYKTYIRKGSRFLTVYENLKYMGASIKGQDFLYWTIDGERVPNDYVIDGDTVRFNAKYTPTKDGCLTITARVDNCTLTFAESVIEGQYKDYVQYWDGTDWVYFTTNTLEIELEHIGDQIYIKRDIETGISGHIIDSETETNKPFSISGPLESFVGGNTVLSEDGIFVTMFEGSSVVSATNLQFDHITALSESCYQNMFLNCSLLIAAPELPTLNLVVSCYTEMFHGCSSLVVAPTLPAQVLKNNCYESMFAGCTSLVSVQKELPITQLAESCCKGMFSDCASLMTVPALPDNIALKSDCYNGMFSVCTSLRISENGSGTKIFTCPSTEGFDPSPVQYMFSQTSGLFEGGTPTAGNTYYYY